MLTTRVIALLALGGCSSDFALSAREADIPCFTARDCSTGFVCLENLLEQPPPSSRD